MYSTNQTNKNQKILQAFFIISFGTEIEYIFFKADYHHKNKKK